MSSNLETEMSSKFPKFSDKARDVLNLSQAEAELFDNNFIGPEHILVGILIEGDGIAAKALVNLGLKLVQIRQAVEASMRRGARESKVGLNLAARSVVEFAVDETRQLHNSYIGTEHLLLGLLREGSNKAVLEGLGVTLEKVRAEVVRIQKQQP